MPPEQIWLDDEALSGHFESLKLKREMESGDTEHVPMDENDDDEIMKWRRA
jgi:hypothetical protein